MKTSIRVDIVVERSEILCSMTESFCLVDAKTASDVKLKIQHIMLKLYLGQFRTGIFIWKNSIYVWLLVV